MPRRYSRRVIASFLRKCDDANTNAGRGKALEDLTCYIFEKVPGVKKSSRNIIDYRRATEIDIVFLHDKFRSDLMIIDNLIFLVECKNHKNRIGNRDVSYFIRTLQKRSCEYGIFVSLNGITGNPKTLTGAQDTVADALAEGIRVRAPRKIPVPRLDRLESRRFDA
jgi:predicted helicase